MFNVFSPFTISLIVAIVIGGTIVKFIGWIFSGHERDAPFVDKDGQ